MMSQLCTQWRVRHSVWQKQETQQSVKLSLTSFSLMQTLQSCFPSSFHNWSSKEYLPLSLFRPKWAKDIIFLTLKIAQICSQKYSWNCMWRNVPKRSKVYQIEIETVSQKINIRFNILPPCCKLWSSSPVRQSWTVPFAELKRSKNTFSRSDTISIINK